MPQEIHVVQCYNCHMYQADIVKKVSKWTCKLCGEKQSLKTVVFRGSGKDCRLQVQKLNELKRNVEHSEPTNEDSTFDQLEGDDHSQKNLTNQTNWSQFLGSDDEDDEAIFVEVCARVSQEHPPVAQERCNESMKPETPQHHPVVGTENDSPSIKRVHDIDCSTQNEDSAWEPPAKLPKKIAVNPSSKWDQFLPDVGSD